MPGIYDLFSLVAKGVEATPWRGRLLGGMALGAGYQMVAGDPDESMESKFGKGIFLGGLGGLGASAAIRAGGRVAQSGAFGLRKAAEMKVNKFKSLWAADKSFKTFKMFGKDIPTGIPNAAYQMLSKPHMLGLLGAGAGALIAPDGHKMQGAIAGAGIGYFSGPIMSTYKSYEKLGAFPGAKSAALITAAGIPVMASAILGNNDPVEATAVGNMTPMGIGYQPGSESMKDRVTAMNASGDIVLGLHNRAHGL